MISDGVGFNGWLAADYYQGVAGQRPYQIDRPDGTKSVFLGLSNFALNLIDERGEILPSGSEVELSAGVVPQGYDPSIRWKQFENAMRNDFDPNLGRYTSYTDSAAAGTALMTGRKTSNGRINMDWKGVESYKTIAEIAMEQGLAAGLVTSVMASDATPATMAVHSSSRKDYVGIFKQLINSDLDVILGTGHPHFDNSGSQITANEEKAFRYVGGSETFSALTSPEGLNGYTYIETKSDFESLASGKIKPDRVVGIAQAATTLQASREGLGVANTPSGIEMNSIVPDLATMSLGALRVLSKSDNGLLLMIEGGAVDWMGHDNNMPRYIEEQIDFNLAVDSVIRWVEENSSWEETLLIITSDHETGGIWGEGTWTNGLGGPVASTRSKEALQAARYNPKADKFNGYLAVQNRGVGNLPGYMFSSRNHTNELVPLWALGAGSNAFYQFAKTDVNAANLWGELYGWNGEYIDNTLVFEVMKRAITEGTYISPSNRKQIDSLAEPILRSHENCVLPLIADKTSWRSTYLATPTLCPRN